MAKNAYPYPTFMIDAETLSAVQRRHVDTLTVASKIFTDGLKAAARQQSDRMRTSVQRVVETAKQVSTDPVAFKPDEQLAEMKTAYLTALDDANTVTGLLLEAQAEAAKVMTQGILANVDDLMGAAKAA